MVEKLPSIPTGEMPDFETPTFEEYPELGQQEVTEEKFAELFPKEISVQKAKVRELYFDSDGNLQATSTEQIERKQRSFKENIETQFKQEDWPTLLKKEDKEKFITQMAPKLPEEDFLNYEKKHIDFSSAQNLEQLIRMVENQKFIMNQKGQLVSSDVLVDLIYDRVLNRQSFHKDWTKITLRHRLRETVYKLAEEYMNRPEYAGLANLNLEKINSIGDLKTALRDYEMLPDVNGKMTNSEIMTSYIDNGRFDLLPMPLQYKLKHLQQKVAQVQDKVINQTVNKPTWKDRVTSATSRFTSWLKR